MCWKGTNSRSPPCWSRYRSSPAATSFCQNAGVNSEGPVPDADAGDTLGNCDSGAGRREREDRIRGDLDAPGRNSDRGQQVARGVVANGDAGGGFSGGAGVAAAVFGKQRAHADGVEHQGFREQCGEQGGSDVEAESEIAGREQAVGQESAVVVEEAAAAHDHQVRGANGHGDGQRVAPGNRVDAMKCGGMFGISGNNRGGYVAQFGAKLFQQDAENGFVTGVVEAVVSADQNARRGQKSIVIFRPPGDPVESLPAPPGKIQAQGCGRRDNGTAPVGDQASAGSIRPHSDRRIRGRKTDIALRRQVDRARRRARLARVEGGST